MNEENNKKIICPKCGSEKIKKEEGPKDFLHRKGESEPAKKQYNNINENKRFCLNCGNKWDYNEK